jgi:hypothetical protein
MPGSTHRENGVVEVCGGENFRMVVWGEWRRETGEDGLCQRGLCETSVHEQTPATVFLQLPQGNRMR